MGAGLHFDDSTLLAGMAGRARDSQAQPGQNHPDDSEAARTPPVGERTARNPKAEVE